MASAFILAALLVGGTSYAEPTVPTVEETVARVKALYSRHCCFRAAFNQLTVNVAMDLKDRFKGMMYVKRPGLIALDVKEPEKQHVVIRGSSYTVYFPEDGNAVKGEVPPDINVEHFFGFFANVGNMDRNFTITSPNKSYSREDGLVFLELRSRENPRSTYRIVLGIDLKSYTIRRAIIYDALGNYNRFDLSEISLLDSLPDSRFEINYGPRKAPSPLRIPFLGENDTE
jgi:outer membrane lipoprotein-sorting protein